MKLHNQLAVDTHHGLRTFELYEGDLSTLDQEVDILTISAIRGDYRPVDGTVIGSLYANLQISIEDLARDCEYDLRDPFNIWISRPLRGYKFARILCVEILGSSAGPKHALENLAVGLAILEAKGEGPQSLALPLLGTGNQMLAPRDVMRTLLPTVKRLLERSHTLSRILFVELSSRRVALLSEALDTVLNRPHGGLAKDLPLKSLSDEILETVRRTRHLLPRGHQQLSDDIERILAQDQLRSFEVGILGRRLVEFVVNDILDDDNTGYNLFDRINKLAEYQIASWIRGYMHTLRALGNDSAHERNRDGRIPPFADRHDLLISLFCVQRILNLWVDLKQTGASRHD